MRLSAPDISSLTERQREIHDAIASGPRGGVRGPLAIWLHRPEFAANAQALGAYCRYGTSLAPKLSELAILVTARVWSSDYEWLVHKPIALAAGVPEDAVLAIRQRRTPIFDDPSLAAVHAFASELNRDKVVSEATYGAAVAALGEQGVVDLVGILGYYTLISMTINVFDIPPPADVEREMTPTSEARDDR